MTTVNVILLVILIVVIAKARRGELGSWQSHRHSDRDNQLAERRDRSEREAELEREVSDLRERIKVLERIATEDRSARSLSDEIEKLRDR